jgi:hypothetical protein
MHSACERVILVTTTFLTCQSFHIAVIGDWFALENQRLWLAMDCRCGYF